MPYQARTVSITYLMPRPIAALIAHAYRATRPARQLELLALPVQTIVPREEARGYRVFAHTKQCADDLR